MNLIIYARRELKTFEMKEYTEEWMGIQKIPSVQQDALRNLGIKYEKDLEFLGLVCYKDNVN